MRLFWVSAAALGLALAAGCARDRGQMRTGTDVHSEASGVREGTIGALYEDRMILLDPTDEQSAGMVIRFDDRTDVVRRGERVNVRDLDEGSPVRVFFSEAGERAQAIRVEVLEGDEAERVKRGPTDD